MEMDAGYVCVFVGGGGLCRMMSHVYVLLCVWVIVVKGCDVERIQIVMSEMRTRYREYTESQNGGMDRTRCVVENIK